MSYLTSNWGYPWVAVVAVLMLFFHERGLRSINRRSTASHARKRRRRLNRSYAGLILATVSVVSPLQFWAMQYFWVHMIQHVALMLAAPALYVSGAPLLPLIHSVPVRLRRRLIRGIFVRPRRHPLRSIGAFLLSPWTGIVSFNAVMIVWMVPQLFNNIMMHEELHISLMLGSFFLSGVLFWIHFIPSRPLRPKLSGPRQIVALLTTNAIMTIIAIVISFFATGAWYDFGTAMAHMGSMSGMAMGGVAVPVITLSRFADQQIGAAILWVCGDFWCYPALSIAIQRTMAEGRGPSRKTHLFRPERNMSAEEFLAARTSTVQIMNVNSDE